MLVEGALSEDDWDAERLRITDEDAILTDEVERLRADVEPDIFELLLTLGQQLINSLLVSIEGRHGSWLLQFVPGRPRVLDRLAYRPPTMLVGPADSTYAYALDEVRPTYRFDRFHPKHLLASAKRGNAPW